ncbi:MAG: hypothetical protein M3277_05680 [Actinomycetota bacterium]|nr:hypothetical protein [Actinomycetota bacterium]
MKSSKLLRNISVIASVALLLGAFVAGPADAKKRKKKPAPACAPYTTPSWAEGAETTILTDAATADAPVEVEIATDPGVGFTDAGEPGGGTGDATFKYHNVVVDSAAATAKLFVRIEYPPVWDYDLFLRFPDGIAVAYEADFNPATVGGPTPVGGNEGAHPEPGAGQIDGAESPDCAGYSVEIASAITAGGPVAMTLWLEQ